MISGSIYPLNIELCASCLSLSLHKFDWSERFQLANWCLREQINSVHKVWLSSKTVPTALCLSFCLFIRDLKGGFRALSQNVQFVCVCITRTLSLSSTSFSLFFKFFPSIHFSSSEPSYLFSNPGGGKGSSFSFPGVDEHFCHFPSGNLSKSGWVFLLIFSLVINEAFTTKWCCHDEATCCWFPFHPLNS